MTCTLQFENRLDFLDRNQKQFDWDNEELIESKGLVEEGKIHPGIPHKIPGVGTEVGQYASDGGHGGTSP